MMGGRRQHGFTLVELMVVIVIIGLATAVVMLALPEEGGSIQSEAERFAARTKAARDAAIVEARAASLEIGPRGYDFARRIDGRWQPAGHYDWAERTEIGVTGAAGSRTRFDSTGLAEPMTVTLQRGDRRVAVEIHGDGTVHVRR